MRCNRPGIWAGEVLVAGNVIFLLGVGGNKLLVRKIVFPAQEQVGSEFDSRVFIEGIDFVSKTLE